MWALYRKMFMAPSDHASATTVDPSHSSDCKEGCIPSPIPVALDTAAGINRGTKVFRISTMDCPAEEAEIRMALQGVTGIRGLDFRLAARTLAIDAPAAAMPSVLEAIRRAGFDPQPVAPDIPDEHGHTHASEGMWRLGTALLLAIGAELLNFLAPRTLAFEIAGMALAAAAIGLAGFSTYRKGFAALRQRRLNMNTLMAVAVTGAFLIGQWPEAAMVMALYAIAELIEARAVDRARNAIKSLLDLAPDSAETRMADGSWRTVPPQTFRSTPSSASSPARALRSMVSWCRARAALIRLL